jgi:hypothetical protein
MRQHPLQVGYNPFVPARTRTPIVHGGRHYLRQEDLEATQRVVDPAAEWQRIRDERPWEPEEISGPFGTYMRDWWT